MRFRRLLYVSESQLPEDGSRRAIARILIEARRRNASHLVTGALIHTGRHFAQSLEGRPDDVQAIFDRVTRDRRHRAIRTLSDHGVERRLFEDWSMGLCSAGHGMQSYVDDALKQPSNGAAALEALMTKLVTIDDLAEHMGDPKPMAGVSRAADRSPIH